MKKIKLSFLLLMAFNCIASAQYFQWAHETPFSNDGTTLSNIVTDHHGNSFFIHQFKACQACAVEANIMRADSSGNLNTLLDSYSTSGGFSYGGLALDDSGNIFVSAQQAASSFSIQGFNATTPYFVLKADSSGVVKWLEPASGFFKVAADSSDAVYYTNSSRTEKRDENTGVLLWTDTITGGGSDIAVDGNHRCIVTDTSHTVCYNADTIFYNKPYGGKAVAANRDGTAFILSSEGLQKLDSDGNITWSNAGILGNDVATDDTNAYVANSTAIERIASNGLSVTWTMPSSNAPFNSIALDTSKNILAIGNYDIMQYATVGPYKLFDGFAISIANQQGFIAKVNAVLLIPFQAVIFTGDLTAPYSNSFCKHKVYSIPFTTYVNSVSAFGGGNQFRAQISNNNFVSYTDIGPAAAAQVPASVIPGAGYRVRVVSTNPVVNGYLNYNAAGSPLITVHENEAIVNASGPLTFCQGDSVMLTAVFQNYTNAVSWSTGSTDTSITVKNTGQYICYFINGFCFSTDTINVTVIPKPPASITPSGNLSFCTGPGITLQANTGAGLTYQWRKNSVNIAGATGSSYLANTTGNFNVVVTNSSGCSKGAVSVNVTGPPGNNVTALGPTHFCIGGSVTLQSVSGQPVTYQWRKNGFNIPGATAQIYVATTTGNYNCIVTNSTGCSKGGINIAVTGPPSAVITANSPTTFCAGGSVLLSAQSGYTYQWIKNSNNILGAILQTYTATTAGNYKVKVTDQFGCSKTTPNTNQITVTVPCREVNPMADNGSDDIKIFPNPTSSTSTISYSLHEPATVSIYLVDVMGKRIATLLENKFQEGFNSTVMQTEKICAGIYLVELRINKRIVTGKVVVFK